MSWIDLLWLLLIGAWLYACVTAVLALRASGSTPSTQKFAQGAIVLLIPFLGAWLVLHILADSEPSAIPKHLVGSRGLGWYIIAGTYDGPWIGGGNDGGTDAAGGAGSDQS